MQPMTLGEIMDPYAKDMIVLAEQSWYLEQLTSFTNITQMTITTLTWTTTTI